MKVVQDKTIGIKVSAKMRGKFASVAADYGMSMGKFLKYSAYMMSYFGTDGGMPHSFREGIIEYHKEDQ